MSDIARRLRASVRMGAHNGDSHERGVCARQMTEAACAIEALTTRLAEAERTRANELSYVAEACKAASLARATHESRDALLDLRAWATSRLTVKAASSSAPAVTPNPPCDHREER